MDSGQSDGSLSTGRRALARADWAEARAAFTAALKLEETVEGYEGLGIAARYELDGQTAITVHESGYRLARRLGNDESAARLAIQLAYDASRVGRRVLYRRTFPTCRAISRWSPTTTLRRH